MFFVSCFLISTNWMMVVVVMMMMMRRRTLWWVIYKAVWILEQELMADLMADQAPWCFRFGKLSTWPEAIVNSVNSPSNPSKRGKTSIFVIAKVGIWLWYDHIYHIGPKKMNENESGRWSSWKFLGVPSAQIVVRNRCPRVIRNRCITWVWSSTLERAWTVTGEDIPKNLGASRHTRGPKRSVKR